MRKLILLVSFVLVVFLCGCADKKPTEITAFGQDAWCISPDDLDINASLYFMPNTQQGDVILAINGPGGAIGFQLRKDALIYFQDDYIATNDWSYCYGTVIPVNIWTTFNYVRYKSDFAGWFSWIGDFWPWLNATIVDQTLTCLIKFIDDGDGSWSAEIDNGKSINLIEMKKVPIESLYDKYPIYH